MKKIRILDGTIQYKRKEYGPSRNILELPDDVVESCLMSKTCEVEIVDSEESKVITPGAVTDAPLKIETKPVEPVKTPEDIPNEGTVDWYKMKLDELGVDYKWDALKSELVELYEEATEE